jgi:hypothetical protein
VGQELAPVCGSIKSEEFIDYVIQEWNKLGYVTSCPLNSKLPAT